MAPSVPRSTYTSDQRQLSVFIAADRKGGTYYHVLWRECPAGEERMREVTLLKGHWKPTLNERAEGIRALAWILRALMPHLEPPK